VYVARVCYFTIQQKDQPSQMMLAWDDEDAVTQVSDTYWAQFYYRQTMRQWFDEIRFEILPIWVI